MESVLSAFDRISRLPKNVTETIFIHLPLRDMVRTSILSRYWRYKWHTVPQLVFDEDCIPYPEGKEHRLYNEKLTNIMSQVGLLHHGPIRKLKLAINSHQLESYWVISNWIFLLSRNGIEVFTFETWGGNFYKMPSHLFLCEELTYLRLEGCRLTLPASFKGFSSLTVLNLQRVEFLKNELEVLISCCPLLTKLVLENISGCDHLSICASKLVELKVSVGFKYFQFENTPLLSILSIDYRIGEDRAVLYGDVCKLSQIFGRLPVIEMLELSGLTFPVFSGCYVPVKLPTAYHLKYLSFDINLQDRQQIVAALVMFRSSPILQKLRIKASSEKNTPEIYVDDLWIKQEERVFIRLRILEVTNFIGTACQLKLVKFVLANAPALEVVRVHINKKATNDWKMLNEVMNFRRVSPKAKLLFVEAVLGL